MCRAVNLVPRNHNLTNVRPLVAWVAHETTSVRRYEHGIENLEHTGASSAKNSPDATGLLHSLQATVERKEYAVPHTNSTGAKILDSATSECRRKWAHQVPPPRSTAPERSGQPHGRRHSGALPGRGFDLREQHADDPSVPRTMRNAAATPLLRRCPVAKARRAVLSPWVVLFSPQGSPLVVSVSFWQMALRRNLRNMARHAVISYLMKSDSG